MIRRLTVKNYLIFKDVRLEFGGGFNVISGETGAGKSLIADVLSLLAGGRVDWDSVPERAHMEMVVEGDSEMERVLSDLGIPYDGEVVIRRTLNPSNRRSRILINDMQVSAGVVRRLLDGKIFVGSQFSHTTVDDPTFQTEVLDRFGGIDITDYAEVYAEYVAKLRRLRKLERELSDLKEREDYLRFQLNEIRRLNLREGEEEELIRRREELEERVRTREWGARFMETYPIVRESLTSLLRDAPERFRRDLETMLDILSDMAFSIPDGTEEEVEEEFNRINARLYEIGRLKARFRTDFAGLLRIAGSLERDLSNLRKLEEEVERMRVEIERLEEELGRLCDGIDATRVSTTERFAKYVEDSLRALGFEHVEVEVSLESTRYYERGRTVARLLISTVPGVAPHRVSDLSGGELSRTALVLFSTGSSRYRTLVLDEVDTGVSPSVADRVGRLLRRLSEGTQIMAITHQAFTALHAHRHFVVERADPSTATVREVRGEERWRELGRMMGVGDPEIAKSTLRG